MNDDDQELQEEAFALGQNLAFRRRVAALEQHVAELAKILTRRALGSTDPEMVKLGARIHAVRAAIASMKGEENGDREE